MITLITILILSVLSTLIMLKLLVILLNTTIEDLIFDTDDAYTAYQLFLSVLMTFTFFIVYYAINNTFFHFKY